MCCITAQHAQSDANRGAEDMTRTATVFAAIAAAFGLAMLGGGIAQADPPGNTPNDPHNARVFCDMVAANPTPTGMSTAIDDMSQNLNNDDVVDAAAYAMMYTCPQYRPVFRQLMAR
jgi:hypothetical protein